MTAQVAQPAASGPELGGRGTEEPGRPDPGRDGPDRRGRGTMAAQLVVAGLAARAACNGGLQSTTVTVTAGDRVFKKGTAVATAEAFTCGFSFCGTISDSREITISR
jgi:hypothetical protein